MNLYTCKHYYPNLILILIILIPIVVGMYYLFNIKNQYISDTKRLVSEGILFLSIGVIFFVIYIFSYVDSYKNIFLARNSSSLQTIEGYVVELKKTNFFEARSDSFKINDEEFYISTNPFYPGYHKPAVYGGVINKEGMKVRISFVEYDNNKYIMSIDLIVE